MYRQCFEKIRTLEDVETPGIRRGREARFGWFIIFEDDGGIGHGVCFCGEFTRGGVVRFLFFDFFGWFYDGAVGCWVFAKGCLLRGERGI